MVFRYNLNSKYGTSDDLRGLIKEMRAKAVCPMVDVVSHSQNEYLCSSSNALLVVSKTPRDC